MPSFNTTNTTTLAPPSQATINVVFGYITLAFSGIFFGSASLPIKKFETGDGLTFQLASAIGLWSIGVIINCIRDLPKFYFLPMLGGFFFTTANAKMVPIIKTIGIGMGTSIRATIGIIVGWANARFGIFDAKPEPPADPILNIVGVVFSLAGAVFFIFVKPQQAVVPTSESDSLLSNDRVNAHIIQSDYEAIPSNIDERLNDNDYFLERSDNEGKKFLKNLSPLKKRIIGLSLSITAGIFVGCTYAPYLYVVDRYDEASQNGLDYIFSMYTGALFTSLIYFIVYCIIRKNRPYVNIKSIIPGFVNGWIWGVGVCCFLFSNSVLSQAITFPIACGTQTLVGVLFGVFLYREIYGRRNFIILSLGFVANVVGTTLCAVSKY